MNQCNFIGRFGKDVEMRTTTNGMNVANTSMAVSKKRKGEETTEWINLVMFGKTAEFAANYLGKGSLVRVTTERQTRKWQDKNGSDRYTVEDIVQDLESLGSKSDRPAEPQGGNDPQSGEGDLPF